MTTPTPLLELREIDYAYPDGPDALHGISLTIPSGAKLALLGANGAGKSTLLLHLNGTLRPRRGQVIWRGQALDYSRTALNAIRSEVAVVFQNPDDQLFAGTVREDISFGPMNLGLPEPEVRRRVETCLTCMGLEAVADRPPHRLSFGQKKRAAIAGALAMHPSILVLDEPTAGLDPRGKSALLDSLATLHRQGVTLVISTHDLALARNFATEALILDEGRILAADGIARILTNPSIMLSADLA